MMLTGTDAHPKNANQETEPVERLKASGALDELFSKIGACPVEPTANGGLVPALLKTTLERGLPAEISSHLGY